MRKFIVFLTLLSLLCACNLLKRTDSTFDKTHLSQSEQLQLSSLQENNWLSTSGLNTVDVQDGQASYRVMFWTKGNFTFSPQEGFSGTADSVMVTGRSASNSMYAASAVSKIQDKGKVETGYSHQAKTLLDLSAKKKSSSPSWKFLIPAIVVLILLAGYAILKLKTFLNLKFKS